MNNRDLLALARNTLTDDEIVVWIAKHYTGLGRRAGSLALGISEDAYRYRLAKADAAMHAAIAVKRRGNGFTGAASVSECPRSNSDNSSLERLTRKDAA